MFKINLVVCLFYFVSPPLQTKLTLHDMLLRRAVSSTLSCSVILWLMRMLLELLLTDLGWGETTEWLQWWRVVKCLPGISSSPSHCRTWPCRGCFVCGWLPASLSPLHSHTRCHSHPPHDLQPVIRLYTFLVAKVTQEMAGRKARSHQYDVISA